MTGAAASAIPKRRQTLLFSATMPANVQYLADSILTRAVEVRITPEAPSPGTVEHHVYLVERRDKVALLEYLLSVTGPADVRITSFSLTEVAVRTFLNLMEKKGIAGLKCIFDLSVRQHKAGLLFFASNITSEIALAKIHAKLILIGNKDWKIAVTSSANLQINDKVEAGIVAADAGIYSFFLSKFDNTFHSSLKITKDGFD